MLRSGMGESPDGAGIEQSRINRTYTCGRVGGGVQAAPSVTG